MSIASPFCARSQHASLSRYRQVSSMLLVVDRFSQSVRRCTVVILLGVAVACVGCGSRIAETSAVAEQSHRSAPGRGDSAAVEASFLDQLALGRANQRDRIEMANLVVNDQELKGFSAQDDWLRTLILDAGRVSDEGIREIVKLPRLSHLRLRDSPITDQGLQQLANCPAMQILNLPHCHATAMGIEHLAALPDLRNLRLGGPSLTADTAAAIAMITSLRNLHLIAVPIDDQGLRRIATLPKLQSLYLDDCAVTQEGWDWLFQNHPDLHVHVNQTHLDRDPQNH